MGCHYLCINTPSDQIMHMNAHRGNTNIMSLINMHKQHWNTGRENKNESQHNTKKFLYTHTNKNNTRSTRAGRYVATTNTEKLLQRRRCWTVVYLKSTFKLFQKHLIFNLGKINQKLASLKHSHCCLTAKTPWMTTKNWFWFGFVCLFFSFKHIFFSVIDLLRLWTKHL